MHVKPDLDPAQPTALLRPANPGSEQLGQARREPLDLPSSTNHFSCSFPATLQAVFWLCPLRGGHKICVSVFSAPAWQNSRSGIHPSIHPFISPLRANLEPHTPYPEVVVFLLFPFFSRFRLSVPLQRLYAIVRCPIPAELATKLGLTGGQAGRMDRCSGG